LKKILQAFLFVLALAASLHAQAPAPDYTTEYSPEQLDQLVGPIALYPDPLVALILPAATAPSDIVIAAQYLAANGDPTQIAAQPWDDSVKALANYPTVIQWMSNNLDWATSLGRAFLQQPTQVMESIQQLRAAARANGSLVSTPQQTVILNGSDILIEPATSDAISVPEYDPDLVFGDEPVDDTTPLIYFGQPYQVGPWLSYECDWDDYGIWLGTWHPGWAYTRDWRQARPDAVAGGFWRADPVHQRELLHTLNRPLAAPPHPRPMDKAPAVAQRGAAVSRPAARAPSRPDPTGWRADGSGELAVPPRAAAQTGPKVIASPQSRAPDLNEIHPQNEAPAQPSRTPAMVTAPQVARPTPAPTEVAPREQSAPARAAAPGPVFGGYSRGTAAQDYSNRGQTSRAAAMAPPEPAARPAPAEVRSEPAAPRAEAPQSAPRAAEPPPAAQGGQNGNLNNRH
jgi:hypothetical protein